MAYKRKFPVEFDESSEEESFDSSEKEQSSLNSDVTSAERSFDSSEEEQSSVYSYVTFATEEELFDSSDEEQSSQYSDQVGLRFDDISEEDLSLVASKRPKTDINKPFCDPCLFDIPIDVIRVVASYICYVCGKYYCKNCFSVHDRSHGFLCVESKSGELDGEIDEFVSYMMNESEKERKESLRKTNVCVCDYVDKKHELDKVRNCRIYGLAGYKYKWWVACDFHNYCIKVFRLGSNALQRYIRLCSRPYDVTEIIVENTTTEQDSAYCSETAISVTDNKTDRKHFLAVTLPCERLIFIIDLGKNPAVIHRKIEPGMECCGIDFYDGNIYTVCCPPFVGIGFCYFVSIMSVEGVELKLITSIVRLYKPPGMWYKFPLYHAPRLTVLNGNIYMTDPVNKRVVCCNDEGRVLHEITIDRSWPYGICGDRREDKVYISTTLSNTIVHELESDLSRYKLVLDGTAYCGILEKPNAMCLYSDKLYVGYGPWSKSRSHVTVVRLV